MTPPPYVGGYVRRLRVGGYVSPVVVGRDRRARRIVVSAGPAVRLYLSAVRDHRNNKPATSLVKMNPTRSD